MSKTKRSRSKNWRRVMTVLILSYARHVTTYRPLISRAQLHRRIVCGQGVYHSLTMNSLHPTWLSSLSANYNFQAIVVAYQIVYYCSCCIAQSTSTCFLIFRNIGFLLLHSILQLCINLSQILCCHLHSSLPYWSLHNHDYGTTILLYIQPFYGNLLLQ